MLMEPPRMSNCSASDTIVIITPYTQHHNGLSRDFPSSPSFLPSFLLHFTHSHHTAATYKYPNHSQLFPSPSPPHFLSPESPESPQTVTSAGGWGHFLRQRDGDGVLGAVSRLQLRFYSPLIREPCETQRERR